MQIKNMKTIGAMSTIVTPLDQPQKNFEMSAISGQQETKFIIIAIPPEGVTFLRNGSAV